MANARELVLKSLHRIENEGAYSNRELTTLLAEKELAPQDRGFVTELLLGVVQNKLWLDYVIGQFSNVKLKKLSPWIHGILRLGVYQILSMERVPDSAACNEMVKLAGKYSRGVSRGFVNGVLRNVSRNKEGISYPKATDEYLSVRYSCPLWLTKKLIHQYGTETCEEILKASLCRFPVTVRVNPLKTTQKELLQILGQEGISAELPKDSSRYLVIGGAINVNQSASYGAGLYTLQNTSSMAAAEMLGVRAGERVLDLCAAPGGKTTYLGEEMQNQGEIIACDLHPHKIPLIQSGAKRLGIENVEAMVQDGTVHNPKWEAGFDRVLADVPCSGIGVIHKKPDIKWKRQEEDIPALCEIQQRILTNAGKYVKQGGTLVYSTCTILEEENQMQAEWFLEAFPEFSLVEEKTFLTHQTGGSGFYIAKFLRGTK